MHWRYLGFPFAFLQLLVSSVAMGQASDSVRIREVIGKDAQYQVRCLVDISGTLNQAKPLNVEGKSSIQYDERILRLNADGLPDRTIRYYQEMEFKRKVGKEEQQSRLRPEVRRLVILRHQQYEVPFCPNGPLMWGEIDLVRTDVFVPALTGLFPAQMVSLGDTWRADKVAVQELTDLDKLHNSNLVCKLENVSTFNGQRIAKVQFEGKVQGVGEDGGALHELRGHYYFDLDAGFMSYISVKGTHHMLDKNGAPSGKIEGSFVMTRSPKPLTRELTDESLRGFKLEPDDENSLLLFHQPSLGVRFLYPRNWRVAGVNDKQIGVDEKRGSGMLISLSRAADTPDAAKFYDEVGGFLLKQQAKLTHGQKPRNVLPGIDTFMFEGEIAGQKVVLRYYTIRRGSLGATIASRIPAADAEAAQRDIDRMVRTLDLAAPK